MVLVVDSDACTDDCGKLQKARGGMLAKMRWVLPLHETQKNCSSFKPCHNLIGYNL